jgi:hypothetical protein
LVRRSTVEGVIGAPKFRFGRRRILLDGALAARLAGRRLNGSGEEELVFPSASGTPLNPNNVTYRVLVPAARRAGVPGVGFHAFRHYADPVGLEKVRSFWAVVPTSGPTLPEWSPPTDSLATLRNSPLQRGSLPLFCGHREMMTGTESSNEWRSRSTFKCR